MSARRGRFQGVWQIVQYNWPFYLASLSATLVGLLAVVWLPLPEWLRLIGYLGVAAALYFTFASLVVSYYVYDASGMYDLGWLDGLLPATPARWANIHAGLDETTPQLQARFGAPADLLDIYDPVIMTEASIARARALTPPEVAPRPARLTELVGPSRSWDVAFLVFVAHEIRDRALRVRFLQAVREGLKPDGRVVLVEHLRDAANYAVFGPGALHFLPRSEWLLGAEQAGLQVEREQPLTPFVRIFVLRHAP